MNNEPVAWMYEDANGTMKMLGNTRLEEWVTKFGCKEISLYIHPAKTLTDDPLVNFKPIWQEKPELTLTDEEIESIANANVDGHSSMEQLKWFARAILKKAQEK
jgi:hypothetical protein